MATFKEHLQNHSKRVVYHVKQHHKKYLFGIVGGAIAIKLALTFIASIGLYEGYNTFAQEFTGEVIPGDSNTGEVIPGEVIPGEVIPGDSNTGEVIPGEVIPGEVIPGDSSTGEVIPGEVIPGDSNTGEVIPGDSNTGEVIPGDSSTGEVIPGDSLSGGFTQESQQLTVCNNSDFNFINPTSGSKLKGTINFSWTYLGTDCSGKNFNIYLRDHNNQRIKIGTSSYLNTRFQFDSFQLYSGFYNILSSSGDIIYTGQYSGLNSQFYTAYKIKFIDDNQNIFYTGDIFTIDNQLPEITGVVMEFTGNYNMGYVGLSGIVNLNFTSTEDLTGIVINILGSNASFVNKSGLNYSYSLMLSSQNTGSIVYSNILFSDLAGNTGSKYLTSQILFDKVVPVLDYIIFTGTYTGVDVLRSGNELTKYTFTYTLSGSQTGITLTGLNYLYTGGLNITGLIQNKIYNFIFKLTDPVNNILAIGGNVSFTTGGKVLFTYKTIILSGSIVLNAFTGSTGSTIATIMKQEINKFNNCKSDIKITNINIKINNQDIKLAMPNFDKSDIRKIVNSFTIVIMDKLQKSTLTKSDLDDIVNRFDDFLIILKLVRDDDNQCKQNLSSYHIRLFQKTLQEYNISIE